MDDKRIEEKNRSSNNGQAYAFNEKEVKKLIEKAKINFNRLINKVGELNTVESMDEKPENK